MDGKSVAILMLLLLVAIYPPFSDGQELQCETSVPSDYKITTPGKGVPEEFARFSGVWNGYWGTNTCHILVIEEVKADGEVKAIYAWGKNLDAGFGSGYQRRTGKIEGDELKLNRLGNGPTASYKYKKEKLFGLWEHKQKIGFSTLTKITESSLKSVLVSDPTKFYESKNWGVRIKLPWKFTVNDTTSSLTIRGHTSRTHPSIGFIGWFYAEVLTFHDLSRIDNWAELSLFTDKRMRLILPFQTQLKKGSLKISTYKVDGQVLKIARYSVIPMGQHNSPWKCATTYHPLARANEKR